MASTILVKKINYDSPLHSEFQDLSFSSYLKPKEKSLLEIEINPAIDDTEISIFDAQKYFSEANIDVKDVKKGSRRPEELQKAVVSRHDLPAIGRRLSVSDSVDGYGKNLIRSRSVKSSNTPTASSEASWNSQTGLLTHRPGSVVGVSFKNFPPAEDESVRRNSAGKARWPFLGRGSCCIGKKSVQVKETTSDSENSGPGLIISDENIIKKDATVQVVKPQIKPAAGAAAAAKSLRILPESNLASIQAPWPPGRQFLDGVGAPAFSFPILASSNPVPKKTKPIVNGIEEPSRKSLEIFQAIFDLSDIRPVDNSGSNRTHFIPGSPLSRVANMDDDARSDASSDLFEIESLSIPSSYTNTTYLRRDSLEEGAEAATFNARRFTSGNGINVISSNPNIQFDTSTMDEPATPSVAATECYAPSEVSIDWSVTTAEGFDKASVTNFSVSASEIGKVRFLREKRQQQESGGDGHEGEAGKRKGNGLLLMGCRQEKAVSVQGMQPAVKCVAEGPAIFPLHVGGRPPRASKPPVGGSARLSLAFAA